MSKWMLAAGAAALAMMSPALAERGQGGGKGGGKNHAAHNMKSDKGGARAQKTRGGGADRGAQVQKARGGGRDRSGQQVRGNKGDRGQQVRVAQDDNRGRGRGGEKVRVNDDDNRGRGQVKFDDRGKGNARVVRVDDDDVRVVRLNRHDDDFRWTPRWDGNGLRRGYVDGCPPGLAMKGNGCLPPGQAKKLVGTVLAPSVMSRSLVGPYRMWYPDNDDFIYRWDDDYIYRVRRDGGLIDALFPYANRDYYYYPVGAPYPDYFNYYNVPYQYQSFYPNGGDYLYRYGDGAIYMVNPETQMISGIAALLTGAPMMVGQPLPPAYGVYNVPMAYRSSYYDTPDAWYRYNDGYIYRVDPTTMLVTSVINALV